MTNEECLGCHEDPSAVKQAGDRTVSVHVDPKSYAASVHGPLSCTDCHSDISEYPHPTPAPAKVDCASCHTDQVAAYDKSRHARAIAKGNTNPPVCLSCHGGNAHKIIP